MCHHSIELYNDGMVQAATLVYTLSNDECIIVYVLRHSISISDAAAGHQVIAGGLQLSIVFAARCYVSEAHAVMRCPSVRLSRSWILSKRINIIIFKIFSPSGSHTILVFQHQTSWQYSRRRTPNGGVECRWCRFQSVSPGAGVLVLFSCSHGWK